MYCRLLICTFLLSSLVFAQPTIKDTMTSNSVTVNFTWAEKATMNPESFIDKFFEIMAAEYYMESMDEVFSEVIKEKDDPRTKSTIITKKIYFFAKSKISHFPEALVNVSKLLIINTKRKL